jgi:hypothetical protein
VALVRTGASKEHRHHHQGGKNQLVTADIVSSSVILFNLMMEAILSSKTLILTRATRRHIPQDDILHYHETVFRIRQRVAACIWDVPMLITATMSLTERDFKAFIVLGSM